MNFKGFGNKKTYKNKKSNFNNPIFLEETGLNYYQLIRSDLDNNVQKIRLESEKAYGDELIKARKLILAAYYYLAISKQGIPGRTNDTIGNRLVLITTFFQGAIITEIAISEGNPVKASAALKQDIEILTRLYELKEGKRLDHVPNVKNAPVNFKEHYGDMNNIAHITKPYILENISVVSISDEIRSVSIRPLCNTKGAKELYEIHINLCYWILLEAITLHREMYDDDEAILLPVYKLLDIAKKLLTKAGWIFT